MRMEILHIKNYRIQLKHDLKGFMAFNACIRKGQRLKVISKLPSQEARKRTVHQRKQKEGQSKVKSRK